MASAFGLVMLLGFVAYTLAFTYLWLRRYRLAATELELELSGPEDGEINGA